MYMCIIYTYVYICIHTHIYTGWITKDITQANISETEEDMIFYFPATI